MFVGGVGVYCFHVVCLFICLSVRAHNYILGRHVLDTLHRVCFIPSITIITMRVLLGSFSTVGYFYIFCLWKFYMKYPVSGHLWGCLYVHPSVLMSVHYVLVLTSVTQWDAYRTGDQVMDESPARVRQHSLVEIDHEIFSTVILSLPLIQEGQLLVSGRRMCTSTG